MRHRMWLWTKCMQQIDHKLQQRKQTDEKTKKNNRARSARFTCDFASRVLFCWAHRINCCFVSVQSIVHSFCFILWLWKRTKEEMLRLKSFRPISFSPLFSHSACVRVWVTFHYSVCSMLKSLFGCIASMCVYVSVHYIWCTRCYVCSQAETMCVSV